jgi:hypothetical protein
MDENSQFDQALRSNAAARDFAQRSFILYRSRFT